MLENSQNKTLLLIALAGLAFSGCGGGGDTPDLSKVLQESQLYHPISNPTGAVEQPGQTVVLGLELNDSDLPPLPNAPNKGVEDLWFEVKDAQAMQFTLDAGTQAPVDRVEIRDAGNTVLATLSAAMPATTLALDKGQYQALVYASAAATAPVPVFVHYGAGASATQGAQVPGRVRAQAQYTISVTNNTQASNMFFFFQCLQCNMQGHSLPAWNLAWRDFHGSSFSGANLSGTQFNWAVLPYVNFQGANLTGANLTGANLTGANFSNADLTHAIWVDGVRRCAPGSIGVCR